METKMSCEMREPIKYKVMTFFYMVADMDDASALTDAIIEDVVKDIEETADKDFNSSDVDMAITRVLKKRLIGEC